MDVILLERVETLGQIGDVVKVKPGFARNYLLPQKKALRATEANKARFEQQRAQIEATNLKRRQEAEGVSSKVDGMSVVLIRQAGETGQLFGSVTPRDIAEAITANGIAVERRQIVLDRPIKALGLYPVRVALHPEVVVTVTANVAKSEDEAEIQQKHGGYVGGTAEERAATLDDMLAEADTQIPPELAEQPEAAEEAPAAEAEPTAEKAAKAKKKKKNEAEE